MKSWLKKYALDWPVPVYILLLAVFPILYLYSSNIEEVNFGETLLPLGLSLAGAVVIWALLLLILRNGRKAGLGTALLIFFFFTYGHFYKALENWNLPVPKHAYLVTGVLLIWGYCVYFINRARKDFRATTTVLNVIAIVLIVINLFSISIYEINKPDISGLKKGQTNSEATENITAGQLPDIYYIILDEYAHPDTMKEWYAYDNSRFITSLREKGFYIALGSRVRSPFTPEALAQNLNMEYLTQGWIYDESKKEFQEIMATDGSNYGDPWNQLRYQKIAYNKVAEFLKGKGYKFIYFGNQHDLNRWRTLVQQSADQYYNYFEKSATLWTSEFQDILYSTTMLRPFYSRLTGQLSSTAFRSCVLGTLQHLKEMPAEKGPNFIFAHIYCPHEAFVFGPNGEIIAPLNYQNYRDKQYYLGQYIYISTEIERVVDVLIKNSRVPPIIVIHSDHGLRPMHEGIVVGKDDWKKILNAIYLPGADKTALYDTMSPVNTFRIIFNKYFGAGYSLLEDQ